MIKILITATLLSPLFAQSQNVGIGTSTPAHKLDVVGDINLTGSIVTDGVAAQQNQVLMTDNNGTMIWGNLNGYKNYETFSTVTTANWTVPAGVTKIFVEVWGAGGGASCSGGGGGGGYINAYFTVIPTEIISYTVGNNGSGVICGSTTANNGSPSSVTVQGTTITALGGGGSYNYSGTGNWLGRGGSASVSPSSFKNWFSIAGEDGQPNQINFIQPNASTIWETTLCGRGGNAGNTKQTGATGGFVIFNVTAATIVKYITTGLAKAPGGGGSGNVDRGAIYAGAPGADGRVIFHY